MIASSRTRPAIVAAGFLAWVGSDEEDLESQVAAFRLSELINLIAATLTKK